MSGELVQLSYDRAPEIIALHALHGVAQHCFGTDQELSVQDMALDTLIDCCPRADVAAMDYRHIVRYTWFERRLAQPPQSLVYEQRDEREGPWGEYVLTPNLDNGVFDAITRRLGPLGLDDIIRQRASHLERNQDVLRQAIRDLVVTLPAALWLRQQVAETSRSHVTLTSSERMRLESIRMAELRQPYGGMRDSVNL